MNDKQSKSTKIFLIGAARSGTKLVRDTISLHPRVAKIPYDINYIWKMGNENIPHDELLRNDLDKKSTNRIVNYINKQDNGNPYLIEKTVSNCLRVPFINEVFPDSKYIHLVRDGVDVVESSFRQWNSGPNFSYILNKAFSFPVALAPNYAISYFFSILSSIFDVSKKSKVWGPKYKGIEEDLQTYDLIEVCAIQWAKCVESSIQGLKSIKPRKVLQVKYEDFVEHPQKYINIIFDFVNIHHFRLSDDEKLNISRRNIGKGYRNLKSEQINKIKPLINELMLELNYHKDNDAR